MEPYVAHFRDVNQVLGVFAKVLASGLDPDSASESVIQMVMGTLGWARFKEARALTLRWVGTRTVVALMGSDELLRAWDASLSQRLQSDFRALQSRDEFDELTEGDLPWSPDPVAGLVNGICVPQFGELDELFRERSLAQDGGRVVHFSGSLLGPTELQSALLNAHRLRDLPGFGSAHHDRLAGLLSRPLSGLVCASFLRRQANGTADGLVFDRETAFPLFPSDAFFSSFTLSELRGKVRAWFAADFAHSESVMSRLSRIETRLDELGRARYLAGNLRRAFDFRQLGEAEAAAKARRIAESIAVRVLRGETGKKAAKPFADVIESLSQMPRTRVPSRVITHLEGARRIGNRGAHADEFNGPDVDARDVEVALLQVLNLVEWYLFDYSPKHADS